MVEKKLVGKITHFFTNIGVGVIDLEGEIKVGDRISKEGSTTNFQQDVKSMQIHNKDVEVAKKGDSIGIKVDDRVREGDQVFKITE
ncbi:MAG: translation elongation factor-like protein [Candidatus Aenigmatarchaeota archaeon]|nr:MAG: translation elongation factor-like protein [Candidatus Aenigmarchaeota archaeon]